MVERLRRATNEHDLEALVGCFAADYRNETPAHPERGFTGRDQVRRNWDADLRRHPGRRRAEVLRCAVDGDTVWTEWEHRGTRPDGSPHLMRGVVIFGVDDGLVAAGPASTSSRSRQAAGASTRPCAGRSRRAAGVILVAGGTGRLGTLVVRRLAGTGLAVRVLTRDPARAQHLAS